MYNSPETEKKILNKLLLCIIRASWSNVLNLDENIKTTN